MAVIVAVIGTPRLLRSDTSIKTIAPTETSVAIAEPPTQKVTKPGFQLELPKDWKEVPNTTGFTGYSWQGTLKIDDARRLEVYVDAIPQALSINRLLPVQAVGSGISPNASISDNCINFTDKHTANPQTGAAAAKWAGVSFLCDTANSLREVVGTGSLDGINTVKVKSAAGVSHAFFFVYTDHGGQADFDVLTTILESFKAV